MPLLDGCKKEPARLGRIQRTPGLAFELARSTLNCFPMASRTPFTDEVDAAERYYDGNRAYQIRDSIPELMVGAIPIELLEG